MLGINFHCIFRSSLHKRKENSTQIILIHVPCIFYYFVLWQTNAQLFHQLSHSHMFLHYRVMLKEFVINTLPNYTTYVKHLKYKLYYQQLYWKYMCNLASYWWQVPWGWHDNVETCRNVIICEIIVHLLANVQNSTQILKQIFIFI
jgi:hypothetical protein